MIHFLVLGSKKDDTLLYKKDTFFGVRGQTEPTKLGKLFAFFGVKKNPDFLCVIKCESMASKKMSQSGYLAYGRGENKKTYETTT